MQLTAHLTIFDSRFQTSLQALSKRLGGEKQALAMLYRSLQAQSAVMAYIDVYLILGTIAAVMTLSTLLLKKNKPGGGGPVGIH